MNDAMARTGRSVHALKSAVPARMLITPKLPSNEAGNLPAVEQS